MELEHPGGISDQVKAYFDLDAITVRLVSCKSADARSPLGSDSVPYLQCRLESEQSSDSLG